MSVEPVDDGARERILRGIGVTSGIAIAPVFVASTASRARRRTGSPEEESRALRRAIERAANALQQLASKVDEEAEEILEFQSVLLEDDDMLAPVFAAIAAGASADGAWCDVMNDEIAVYREGDDPVFAARGSDLADLRDRVLAELAGPQSAVVGPTRASIVVARDLAPSRLLEYEPACVAGIALGEGGRTSHVALLARARGIPMVTGLGDIEGSELGQQAVLDVKAGCLTLHPSARSLAEARRNARRLQAARRRSDEFIGRSIRVGNDEPVTLCVNIDHASMLDSVNSAHCDGIGLARTEFLFQHGPPDEDAQLAVYTRLLEWADGRPVTIRTLDTGGDKPLPGISQRAESNPFLGLRGVRLTLAEPALFRTQLRALLRAAVTGPLKIMVPMVTEPSEMQSVARLMDECCTELDAQGLDYRRAPLGMMVEVPAAALCAERFDAAFYSIGSNDLIQYATASARDNAAVAYLARGDHPGVTVMIEAVVDVGRRLGREVSVCGDMASDPDDALRLVKLGVRALSVAPAMLGAVKAALALDAGSAH